MKMFVVSLLVLSFCCPALSYTHYVTDADIYKKEGVPQSWEQFTKVKPRVDGPNCWNFVLHSLGWTKSLRYSHYTEFKHVVKNYCKEVDKEQAQLGDVVRVIDPRTGLDVHAMRYVNPEYSFGKHTYNSFAQTSQQYFLYKWSEVLKAYGQDNKSCNVKRDAVYSCKNIIKYYKCSRIPLNNLEEIYFEDLKVFFKKYLFKKDLSGRRKYDEQSQAVMSLAVDVPEVIEATVQQNFYNRQFVVNLDNNEIEALLVLNDSYLEQWTYFKDFIGYKLTKKFRFRFRFLRDHLKNRRKYLLQLRISRRAK